MEKTTLEINPTDLTKVDDEVLEEMEEAISEAISDITGFCHDGFTWKIVVETELDTSE